MAVLKIKDANGEWQTVQTLLGNAGGSGDAIPKTGDRGVLAGYELVGTNFNANTGEGFQEEWVIDKNTPDAYFCIGGNVKLDNLSGADWFETGIAEGYAETWTKVVFAFFPESVELGENWVWLSGDAPLIEFGGLLVLHVNAGCGFASYIEMPVTTIG